VTQPTVPPPPTPKHNFHAKVLTLIWAREGLTGPRFILLLVVIMFGIQSRWNGETSWLLRPTCLAYVYQISCI